jgi:hypothetical protein
LINIRSININFHYYRKFHAANSHFSSVKNCLDFFLSRVWQTQFIESIFLFYRKKIFILWRKEDDQGYQIQAIFIITIGLLLIMIVAEMTFVVWMKEPPVSQPVSQSVSWKNNFCVVCDEHEKKIPSSSIFLVSSKSNFRSTHYIARDYIVPCYFSSALLRLRVLAAKKK